MKEPWLFLRNWRQAKRQTLIITTKTGSKFEGWCAECDNQVLLLMLPKSDVYILLAEIESVERAHR